MIRRVLRARVGALFVFLAGVGIAVAVSVVAVSVPVAGASCPIPGVTVGCTTTTSPPPPAPDPGGSESPNQPVPATGKNWGFNLGYQPPGDSTPAKSLQAMSAVGVTVLRDGISWRWIGNWVNGQSAATSPSQPIPSDMNTALGQAQPGGYLAHIDQEYKDLTAQGITPLFILSNVPVWASTLHNCTDTVYATLHSSQCPSGWDQGVQYPDPQYYPQWQQWIAKVAVRYPKAIIEGPNEPDYIWAQNQAGKGYPNAVDASTAGDIQCQLFQAVRGVDGRAVLSMAQGFDPNYWAGFISRAHGCYTAFSFHPYPYGTSSGPDTYFGQGSGLANSFAALRSARSAAGDTAPIWVTETGYSYVPSSGGTSDPTTEGIYSDASRRLYNKLITMSDVAAVLFHTLRDEPNTGTAQSDPKNAEYHYGFFDINWNPKPVASGYVPRACYFVLQHGGTWPGC